MTLSAGATLAEFDVVQPLGKGGMGEVYQARDRKLGRDVAIKVLPEHLSQDADRVARFDREARLLASLNHPNIASLHGMGESDGIRFLVLELIEGETLAERLLRGPVPAADALKIAHQISCALEAAHEKGITHRDLKPANVKITPQGRVKVLDFGLAKAMERPPSSDSDPSNAPTMSITTTGAGMILGTAAYMSPEQANGFPVDTRSDLFSLGCVLFEMLSGRQPFRGRTVSEVVASVLARDPDWASLPPNLNPRVRELLQRCLEKDATSRWQAAGDVRVEIERLFSASSGTSMSGQPARSLSLGRRWIPALVTGIVVAAAAGIVTWNLKPSAPPAVTRFQLVLPGEQAFTRSERRLLALSPDGTKLVYAANNQLFLRQMSESEAQPIAGTAGAAANPFFSPDGKWVGFWSISDSRLKKVPITGGDVVPICESRELYGAMWSGDQIVFGEGGKGVMRVSANGGQPSVLVSVTSEEGTAGDPQMIDADRAVLFALATGDGPNRWLEARIVVQPLPSGERKIVFSGGSDAHYLSSGHVIFAQRGNVLAAPFDLKRLEPKGDPVPVIEGVWRAAALQTGAAHLAVADSGALAFIPGGPGGAAVRTTLALVEQSGKIEALPIAPGQYVHPRVSPDGRKLAVMTDDGTEQTIWVYELAGVAQPRRLTFSGRNRYPVWTHDGSAVIFTSDREGDDGLFRQRADGTGNPERLTKPQPGEAHIPLSVDPSGHGLAYFSTKRGAAGVWILPLDGKGETRAFPEAPNVVQPTATFSPDGRWLAYSTTEQGPVPQIFVRSFERPDSKYQITTDGGGMPIWSPDRKQMVYLGGPNRYLALDIGTEPPIASGKPVPLAVTGIIQPLPGMRNFDLMPDGKLLVVVPGFSKNETNPRPMLQINVVLNWLEELKKRVPASAR